jgi:hypothetical protein
MKKRIAALACSVALAWVCIGCAGGNDAGIMSGQGGSGMNAASDPSVPVRITTMQLPDGAGNSPYAAQLTAEGGVAPYIWSAASALPAGVTLSSTGLLAGTPTESGIAMLTVRVQDSEQTPQTDETTLALRVSSLRTANSIETSTQATTATTQYYGAGRGADALANTRVGPWGIVVSYRFVAEHASYLDKIRFYIIPDKAGYAAGTGGKLQVCVETDDGTPAHNPSGTVLASAVLYNPLAMTGKARYFPVLTFSAPPYLSAGKIYHIVFQNIDSSPSLNYSSVDNLWYKSPSSPDQPTVSDAASAVLYRWSGVSWRPQEGYSPIMELLYSNGDYQGYGYIGTWVGNPELISGTDAVRETFTVTGSSRSVSTVGMRLARVSGSGNLTVRLESSSGSLIEQGYLSASSFPLTSPVSHVWRTYTFSTSHTLYAGYTYHLVLEAPSGTVYEAYPIEKGWMYGFDKFTYFPDGFAQFTSGSGWAGWTVGSTTNVTYGDLQFYFGM